MGLTIIKGDSRGKQHVIAGEDMYLDAGGKVIVVKEGEQVPAEAESVLAMRGGRVPARFAALVEAAGVEVKPQVKVKAEAKVKPPSEGSGAKPEKSEEKVEEKS